MCTKCFFSIIHLFSVDKFSDASEGYTAIRLVVELRRKTFISSFFGNSGGDDEISDIVRNLIRKYDNFYFFFFGWKIQSNRVAGCVSFNFQCTSLILFASFGIQYLSFFNPIHQDSNTICKITKKTFHL